MFKLPKTSSFLSRKPIIPFSNHRLQKNGLSRTVLTINSFTAIHLMHCGHISPSMGHKLQFTEKAEEHQHIKGVDLAIHLKLLFVTYIQQEFHNNRYTSLEQ